MEKEGRQYKESDFHSIANKKIQNLKRSRISKKAQKGKPQILNNEPVNIDLTAAGISGSSMASHSNWRSSDIPAISNNNISLPKFSQMFDQVNTGNNSNNDNQELWQFGTPSGKITLKLAQDDGFVYENLTFEQL